MSDNIGGMDFVRPPMLEMKKKDETKDYKEYEVTTFRTPQDRFSVDQDDDNYLFHAGTLKKNKKIYAIGGRVLNFVTLSDSFINSKKNILGDYLEKFNQFKFLFSCTVTLDKFTSEPVPQIIIKDIMKID